MSPRRSPLSMGAVVAVVAAIGCSSPDEGARVDATSATRERFELVSDALVYRCGTLDCHGNTFRNMRLYGYGGLRLEGGTPDGEFPLRFRREVDANYDAVVGLEPEKTAEVVREQGREPDRLALVRKGRATENHKGGPVMLAGDAMDRCLLSWLASAVDEAACREAAHFTLKYPGEN